MEKTKKMTKRELIGVAEEIVKSSNDPRVEMVLNYFSHEIELLDKKANSRTTTKTQQENELIKTILIEELEKIGRPVTISELQNESEVIKNYLIDNKPISNQKISALFKIMVEIDKTIDKVIDKKKSYFSIAE